MTQIYVMTRTTAMDNAFKQVVKSVIPDSYEDVLPDSSVHPKMKHSVPMA